MQAAEEEADKRFLANSKVRRLRESNIEEKAAVCCVKRSLKLTR